MRPLEPALIKRLHEKLDDCTRRLAEFERQPEPADEMAELVRRNQIQALTVSIDALQKAIQGDGVSE